MNYRGSLFWPLAALVVVVASWVGKKLEVEG